MKIYLVGGAVRDALLGRPVKDRDYVVVGASVREMLALGYEPVGKDFPVFLHPNTKDEYALARQERKVGQGYTGFTFDTDPNVTLEQDLLRRDLTVNAMARDESGQLIDPYGGQDDLQHRVFRHVSEAFVEDPLRILRLARFMARYRYLGFTIAPETSELMQQMAAQDMLQELSAPRVWQEFVSVCHESDVAVFFDVLATHQALTPWFSDWAAHFPLPESTWNAFAFAQQHCGLAVKVTILVSALPLAAQQCWCQRLPLPKDVQDLILLQQKHLTTIMQFEQLSASEVVTLLQQCDVLRRPQRVARLINVAVAFMAAAEQIDRIAYCRDFFARCEDAMRSVKAQDLIAQGITGADIKPALEQEQVKAVSAVL